MISVIIPAYNCSSTLSRTLSSLVSQTDSNFKTIIVDDCSTEDITNIVKDYENKLHLQYIRHEKNMGCGMSRETGINNVTTSHFMFCDADDILMPYTVETFNGLVKNNPETEFVHSCIYMQTKQNDQTIYLQPQNAFTICHGKLYSLEAIRRFNLHNLPSIRWADDAYWNSMCSELLKMSIIKQPMAIWMWNQNSVTRKKDYLREKASLKDFLEAMIESCNHVKKYKSTINHLPVTLSNIEPFVEPDTEEFKLFIQLKNIGGGIDVYNSRIH